MAFRVDAAVIARFDRLPSGAVRARARPTKTGVFPYKDAAGNVTREYRPPEEVFAPASLASLAAAALTWLHPVDPVTPSNWKELSIGHVGDTIATEPPFVTADVIVADAANVARVESGEGKELSCGYDCTLDATPGTSPEGEPYDVIQREIIYNHVALLPPGSGRLGRDVALRADAAACIVTDMALHKVDGKDFEAGSAEHIAAVDNTIGRLVKDAADLQRKLAEAEAKAKPEVIAKRISDRVLLLTQAATHKIDSLDRAGKSIKVDEGTDDEILMSILKKAYPELDFAKLMLSHEQMMAFLQQSMSAGSEPAEGDPAAPPPADGLPPPVPPVPPGEKKIDAAQGGLSTAARKDAATVKSESAAIEAQRRKTNDAWQKARN